MGYIEDGIALITDPAFSYDQADFFIKIALHLFIPEVSLTLFLN